MTFKLESKEKFIKESHRIRQMPGDNVRFQQPSNMTPVGKILERLSEFTTPELVGLSVGMGTMFFTLLCLVGFYAWYCGDRICPAISKESWTRSQPPTPTSEDTQQSLPLAARPVQPPCTSQPIREAVNPLVSPDSSELLEDRTLDFLVKTLSALKKATV